ncbi:MAG: energy transducer TonB, partial [Ignavibacteria bacterium]|nr:energy transducer TonB [Ignavibacteria bacterium]
VILPDVKEEAVTEVLEIADKPVKKEPKPEKPEKKSPKPKSKTKETSPAAPKKRGRPKKKKEE